MEICSEFVRNMAQPEHNEHNGEKENRIVIKFYHGYQE